MARLTDQEIKRFSSLPLEQAVKQARNLPPGHFAIRDLEELIAREYFQARQQERAFRKKYGHFSLASLQEVADFSAELCRALGSRPIKQVKFKEPGKEMLAGYYRSGIIYISIPAGVALICHETAHHICSLERMYVGGSHGEDFLMVEQMLFDYLLKKGR